jgi:hypothetical protein
VDKGMGRCGFFLPGTDAIIFKIFSAKNWQFFAQSTASFCKHYITTMSFEINSDLFTSKIGGSCKKIVIKASTDFD